jgi:hypothetical protein
MSDPRRRLEMALAGRLHCTPGELAARLTVDEFNEMIAWISRVEPRLKQAGG